VKTAHTLVLSALAASAALAAPSNVDSADKFAWGENVGYLNFRDAGSPSGAQGVVIGTRFLSGFAWGENIGYVNFGDATPFNGLSYANLDGTDFGVNIDPVTGDLFGLAWGENVGWINFDTRAALMGSGQQARVDESAGRLRGYAWGENIGWINLDDAQVFVGFAEECPGDTNGDGVVNFTDLNAVLSTFGMSGAPGFSGADVNNDGVVNFTDLNIVLSNFGNAC
jgi:hypothetical protein